MGHGAAHQVQALESAHAEIVIGGSDGDEKKRVREGAGVSIAVINNFKVEWAKAHGVKDVETDEDLRFLSPLIRQHLGLYGKYDFDL